MCGNLPIWVTQIRSPGNTGLIGGTLAFIHGNYWPATGTSFFGICYKLPLGIQPLSTRAYLNIPMTPAIKSLQKAKLNFKVHEYQHDPTAESYGLEAAEKMGVDAARVFKTLVVMLDGRDYAVGIIPVAEMLSMKQIAKAAGAKKAAMANKHDVERITGYVLGGVSPLGQKKRLNTFIHSSAQALTTVFFSAGRRGLEIELSPLDLKTQTQGSFVDLTSL